jgi:hypothetical protein
MSAYAGWVGRGGVISHMQNEAVSTQRPPLWHALAGPTSYFIMEKLYFVGFGRLSRLNYRNQNGCLIMRSGQYRLSKRGFLYYILVFFLRRSPSSTLRVFCSRVLARAKRCRLSWLTNSALVYEPKCGGGCGISANEYSCAHGAQINFRDLTDNGDLWARDTY